MGMCPTFSRGQLLLPLAALTVLAGVQACSATGPGAGSTQEGPPLPLEAPTAGAEPAAYRAQGAWSVQGRLFVSVESEGRTRFASAPLRPRAGDGMQADGDPYQRSRAIAVLAATPEPPPEGGEPVPVLDAQRWRALVRRMHESVAPRSGRRGAIIDVLSQHELFVYRDADGAVRSVPIEYKPADLRIEHSAPLDRLLAGYAAAWRGVLEIPASASGLVLYETGDPQPAGYAFVVIDLERRETRFLRFGPAREPTPQATSGALVAQTGAHTVTGHLRSAIEQPLSSVARLVTLTTSTLTDLLRPGALRGSPAPVPPAAGAQPMDPQAWERELDRLVGRKTYPGRVRLLIDGDEFFPALIGAIEDAQRAIDVRVYIFDNDDYAVQIADLLKRRSAQLPVRVLLDGLGTLGAASSLPDYLPPGFHPPASIVQYLTSGSAVRVKVSSNPWMTGDHTKTIIVDNALAFVGGMNIGREYRYEWHDLMVEASGPVVDALRADFDRAWDEQVPLGEVWSFLRGSGRRTVSARPGDYPLRVLRTRPGDSQILRAQIAAIRQAQQRIYIQNAYFTSDAILYELASARRRGVDVRVILPYRNDSGLLRRSNAIAANFMLANGIRVYIYPGMSHVKGAVYDGWACFGSANFDSLSLQVNRELNLATSHAELVDQFVERVFVEDMQRSVELTRPFPERWSDFLTELLADRL